MEQNDINKVELRGRVGFVKLSSLGGRDFLQFSVATNYIYEDYEKNQVVETTWHKCSVWSDKTICPLDDIHKGDIVHLTGRIKSMVIVTSDGIQRASDEIVVKTLRKENEEN